MRRTRNDSFIDLRHWRTNDGDPAEETIERLIAHLPRAIEDELTQRQQQIVRMHFYEDLSVTQIAQQLGLHPSTVSRSLHRSADKLRHFLRYTL